MIARELRREDSLLLVEKAPHQFDVDHLSEEDKTGLAQNEQETTDSGPFINRAGCDDGPHDPVRVALVHKLLHFAGELVVDSKEEDSQGLVSAHSPSAAVRLDGVVISYALCSRAAVHKSEMCANDGSDFHVMTWDG